MKDLAKIKKYYIKKDKIIIKYSDKKVEIKNLNKTNLKKLITKLDKQYDFNFDTISDAKNSAYNRTTYLTFIACLIEGIIAFSIFLSFKGGEMTSFNISSILSLVWLITYFLFLFINFIYLKLLKRKYKICLKKEIIKERYDNLKTSKSKTSKSKSKQTLSLC